MSTTILTKDNFEKEVMQSEKPVLVDFHATWCGPCKMQGPIVEEMSNEMADAKFCTIDVDQEQDLARQFGVMSIPTIMIVKNGNVTFKEAGLRQKKDLEALLK